MYASIAVATVLVAGALVLPYNYAMAGFKKPSDFKITKISIKKTDIKKIAKNKVESEAKAGSANGGDSGPANGGDGGTSTGGSSGAATGGCRPS
jgi:hypothetical protein